MGERWDNYAYRKRRAKLLKDKPLCHYCGVRPATTIDHVVPRSKGGRVAGANEVPACGYCNYSSQASEKRRSTIKPL